MIKTQKLLQNSSCFEIFDSQYIWQKQKVSQEDIKNIAYQLDIKSHLSRHVKGWHSKAGAWNAKTSSLAPILLFLAVRPCYPTWLFCLRVGLLLLTCITYQFGGKVRKAESDRDPSKPDLSLTFLPLTFLTECCFPSAPVLSVQGDKLLGVISAFSPMWSNHNYILCMHLPTHIHLHKIVCIALLYVIIFTFFLSYNWAQFPLSS